MRWFAGIVALAILVAPAFGSGTSAAERTLYEALTVDAYSAFTPLRDPRGGWVDGTGHRDALTGAVALGQMLATFRLAYRAVDVDPLRDGDLRVPEHGNNLPDILDEARWELDWLLSLQVAGGNHAGLLSAGDGAPDWTDLDGNGAVAPPSIAATLSFAAAASAASRCFSHFDRLYSEELRDAAIAAYAAARAHPELAQGDVSGALYWAAAELHVSTGDAAYLADLKASPFWTAPVFGNAASLDNLAGLGRLLLVREQQRLSDADGLALRQAVRDDAAHLLAVNPGGRSTYAATQDALAFTLAFYVSAEARYRDAAYSRAAEILGPDVASPLHPAGAADTGAPAIVWNAALGQLGYWLYMHDPVGGLYEMAP